MQQETINVHISYRDIDGNRYVKLKEVVLFLAELQDLKDRGFVADISSASSTLVRILNA